MAVLFYGWWIVISSFVMALYVGGVLFYGFTAFFDPIVAEFGWSHTQVSIAFSLRGLEMGLLAPIAGFLVDRFGPKTLLLSGTLIVGFALILLSLTNSLPMFYIAFGVLAVGTSGCASTVLMTAVANWFKRHVGKAMGLVACGFGAGGILVPVIIWLTDLFQWRTALVILGLGMWGLGIPLSFVIRGRSKGVALSLDGGKPSQLNPTPQDREEERNVSVKGALQSPNFWRLGIAEAIRMMISMAVITHIMPYLASLGVPRGSAGLVATWIPLLSILGRLGFGWFGDTLDKRYALVLVYGLFTAGTLALSSVEREGLTLVFLLLFAPAMGGGVSLRGAVLREYFGRATFGRLHGIIIGMAAIGGVIGPSAAGWTYDTFGAYKPIWLSFAAASTLAALLVLPMGRPLDRDAGPG